MELLNIKAKKCQYVEWPGDTLKMIFDGKDLSSTLLLKEKMQQRTNIYVPYVLKNICEKHFNKFIAKF